MPLIVPGITPQNKDTSTTSSSSITQQDWATKLLGKKLSDGSSDHTSFAKKDLPTKHRVIEGEGGMMTMDYVEDRCVYLFVFHMPKIKLIHGEFKRKA